MPDVIYDPQKLDDGERYAALYVGYGLSKILVIDPLGLLSHATINRYARRRP